MSLRRFLALVMPVLLAAMPAARLAAQMQPMAAYRDKLLPISTVEPEYMMLIDDDGYGKKVWGHDVKIRAATAFAEGMVEVTDVSADLDPLRTASERERTSPSAVRFKYHAKLTADRGLSECYALLTFVTEGSVGTHLISVGHLRAGSTQTVDVELLTPVSAVGTLHVFSKGLEVRSTQHPQSYDLQAYFAGLVKDTVGLSATELLKWSEQFPHVLSADGHLLATIRLRDAKKMMIVYDLDSMKLVCEAPVAGAKDRVADLTWVSDHEVAYVADGHDYRDETNLNVFDISNGATRKVEKNIRYIIASLTATPEVLLVHQYDQGSLFFKLNAKTGKEFDVEEPIAGTYYFDRNGVARALVRYSGSKRIYEVRPTPGAKWHNIDDLVKQPGLRFNVDGASLLDRMADIHSVGPDGDTLYISTRLGTDKFELAAFSMSQGVIKRVIARQAKYDLTTSDDGLSRLLFAKRTPQLLGMIFDAQKPHVIWIEPGFAAVQKSIDAKFPDHLNMPVDWSDDGTTFIFFSSSDQDPGTYYAFRPLKSQLIPLLELGERLKGRTLAKTQPIEFTARDGQKIPAYLTRPAKAGTAPAPLITIVHGGPTDRDSWTFNAEDQFFASRGYVVLRVNYRGSSGFGAAFQNAGLRARLDTVVIDDIADGVRSVIQQGGIDSHRVVIMGASFGGWATYISLAKYPELYQAGVAVSAVSSWKAAMKDDRWDFHNAVGYAFWKSLLDRQNFSDNEKYLEPYLRVGEINQPVFITHGDLDTIVDASEAQLMLDRLKKRNPRVEARSFKFATHSYWPFDDRVEMLNEIAAFLDKNVPATAAISATTK